MTDDNAPPIACTLGGDDFKDRLDWIADLNRSYLTDRKRDGRRLELTYRPEAEDRVREMISRELECCAFLQFETRRYPDAFRVIIQAPEAAEVALDAIFEPFGSRAVAKPGCVCRSPHR